MKTGECVVVGADGVVGRTIADALGAHRVLYAPPRGKPLEVPIAASEPLVRACQVVFNSQGLRQMAGVDFATFRASHLDTTRALVERMTPGATLVHISSASVLGTLPPASQRAGHSPETFPMADYAGVKWASERLAVEEGTRRGLAVVVLRLSVVNTRPLDGMLKTLVTQARRGVLLDLRPHSSVHHFCSGPLLGAVARRVAERAWTPGEAVTYTVGDPFVVSNGELMADLQARWRPRLRVPLWAAGVGRAVGVASRLVRTRRGAGVGRVLGVIGMDLRYDVGATFDELGLDRAQFGKAATFDQILDEERRLG